jgi:hypothetical protein
MNWAFGLSIGISLGTVLMSVGLQSQRQRWLKELERLLGAGELRVLQSDGSPMTAAELLARLDRAHGSAAGQARQKRWLLLVAVILAAAVAAAAAVLLVNR